MAPLRRTAGTSISVGRALLPVFTHATGKSARPISKCTIAPRLFALLASKTCLVAIIRTAFLLLVLAIAPVKICPADDARPWWKDYHTLLSHSTRKEGREWELGMMAERGGWPTGWYGPWWIQHQVERRGRYDAIKHVEGFRKRGIKNVFYYDVGEFGEFVALVDQGRLS